MSNLVTMVYIGALIPLNERREALVYLPFTSSFFNYICGPGHHKTYVGIRPVYESQLQLRNRKLCYISTKYSTAPGINLEIDEQNSYA